MEQKVDSKKKSQAEMEQEMAALQYTNPMLLEVGSVRGSDPDSGLSFSFVFKFKNKEMKLLI